MGQLAGLARRQGVAVLGVMIAVGGCSGQTAKPTVPTTTHPPGVVTSRPSASPTVIADNRVYTVPKLLGSTRLLASGANRTGGMELAATSRVGSGTVMVDFECQGAGTIKVTVVLGLPTTYTWQCKPTPDGSYNEIGLSSAVPQALVSVDASTGVRWSLAVGWRAGQVDQG